MNGHSPQRLQALATLSADMNRIARLLEGLAGRGDSTPTEDDPALHSKVRMAIDRRQHRQRVFGGGLFGNPGWEMMLDLADANLSGRKLSVSSVCLAASCPPTTALRHLRRLVDAGYVARQPDPGDRRRVYTLLTERGSRLLAMYFADPERARRAMPAMPCNRLS